MRSWHRGRVIALPSGYATARALIWLRADRLLVFAREHKMGRLAVTVLDPLAGRVVTAPRELGDFADPRAAGDRVTLTASAVDGTSNPVLVLDADGAPTARLDAGDLSGPPSPEEDTLSASWTVDPGSGHLLGLAATAPVLVDVDPRAGTATRHAIASPGIPQNWVQGAADATRLAFRVDADDEGRSFLVLVDRATLVAGPPARLTGFNPPTGAGDLALSPSSALSSRSLKGLRAYGLDGVRRWTAEPGHRTTDAVRFGPVIYATVQGVRSTILDAATGQTVGRGPRRPVQLLDPAPGEADQPWIGFGGRP